MKVYYGYENIENADIIVYDQHEDFFIATDAIVDFPDTIPLLHINPIQTTLLYEDYGFRSDSQQHYIYMDMVCAFSIIDCDEQEKEMFLLQVEEELIAVCEEEKRIYILDKHHQPLIKKWCFCL
ncbi:hypothetical protein QUF49_07930 [Fictibacillus sp. b24]|uniref:hypothetical protein n=1 Tax=Fictibacillus sp. b24 TaxID=3055863 RepID=UPI0025A27B67|nr:hypothetical protein [Fictibacillus sp. b24]MDM5315918.1 hypothetical protein [Fictibacillus sp. b24]